MSLASHASINAAIDAPTLDEHGHVVFKTVGRRFSFSRRGSLASLNRLPADGQARGESSGNQSVENAVGGTEEEGTDGAEVQTQVQSGTQDRESGIVQAGTVSSVSHEALVRREEVSHTENDDQVCIL